MRREELHPSHVRWPRALLRLLGKVPDKVLARRMGVAWRTVVVERQRRGIPGCHAPGPATHWTPSMIAALGTDTDRAVAAMLGLTVSVVFQKRRLLGIPPYLEPTFQRPGYRWSSAALARLGREPDGALARRLSIAVTTVRLKRVRLGIAPFRPPHLPVKWPRRLLLLLGKLPDTELARRMGCHPLAVRRKRWEHKIPSGFRRKPVVRTEKLVTLLRGTNRDIRNRTDLPLHTIQRLRKEFGLRAPDPYGWRWTPEVMARLGKVPDAQLAKELGVSRTTVHARRVSAGIASTWHRKWIPAELALLGRAPDAVTARRMKRTLTAVRLKRQRLGIPACAAAR